MIKAIDVLVGLKLLCNPQLNQKELSQQIGCAPSQTSKAVKVLLHSGLLFDYGESIRPVYVAWQEMLPSLKYFFPAKETGLTVGMPTAYAAEPLIQEISPSSDPVPVWPFSENGVRGTGVQPLHPLVPSSLYNYPDKNLYALLALVDALRTGRARERTLGKKYIIEIIDEMSNSKHEMNQ